VAGTDADGTLSTEVTGVAIVVEVEGVEVVVDGSTVVLVGVPPCPAMDT
jgi:hypothetical protein